MGCLVSHLSLPMSVDSPPQLTKLRTTPWRTPSRDSLAGAEGVVEEEPVLQDAEHDREDRRALTRANSTAAAPDSARAGSLSRQSMPPLCRY